MNTLGNKLRVTVFGQSHAKAIGCTIEGLPAGPICSPSKDALLAALNPNPDYYNYYYFGHHDDGTPYYSKTLYEHEYQRDNG